MLAVFYNRRIAAVLLMGFASGLPLALVGTTLQAWMKDRGVDLGTIGLFSLVGMPWGLKFLWAPLMDRYVPPFLGRRRSWIFIAQAALCLTLIAISMVDPKEMQLLTALLAFLISFFSASQDIVSDAYRTEVLEKDELGPGASLYILGYRVAMLTSGALALALADHLKWSSVYLIMAGLMIVAMGVTWMAPEPTVPPKMAKSLSEAVVLPFVEFFRRKGAFEVLFFILLYKIDVVMATALTTPFIQDLGFSKTDLAAVAKGFGLVATIAGTVTGGTLMVKLKMERSLWVFGLAQGISNLTFMWLAHVGHHYPTMVTAIALENFCSGMGNAAFAAFLMSVCDKRYTATQYALLSSLMAITRQVGQAPTGFMVQAMGWEPFFLLSTLSAIPGLLLLTRFKRWTKQTELA